MAKTKLSVSKKYNRLIFKTYTTPDKVTSRRALIAKLAELSNTGWFFVVQPLTTTDQVTVEIEGMDSWRKDLYSGSEGSIYVGDIAGTDKYKVVRRQFVTQSPTTLADIVLSMLAKDWPHQHIQEAEDAAVVWREATPDECNDPSIKWEMEGTSKYGRRMINRERHIYRGLTMSEFYGGGTVD